jgi:hypothetical protein
MAEPQSVRIPLARIVAGDDYQPRTRGLDGRHVEAL